MEVKIRFVDDEWSVSIRIPNSYTVFYASACTYLPGMVEIQFAKD